MEFLQEYGIGKEQLELLKSGLSFDMQKNLVHAKDNVEKIITYFKEIGIDDLFNLILYRSDLLLLDESIIKEKLSKYDSGFIKFVINEDVQNLIIFDI